MANVPYHVHQFAIPTPSEAEARAGTSTSSAMHPLATKQSIDAEIGVTIASYAQGLLASTALQPEDVSEVAISGDYNDLLNKPDVTSVTQQSFSVTPGQTSVTIVGGYEIGRVYQVFLNGVLLDNGSWSAANGSTVTFAAITNSDVVEGESAASLTVAIGAPTILIPALDARYQLRYAKNVREFGVMGDGVTDDTAALQAAGNSAEALLFPAGTYRTTDTLTFTTPQNWQVFGKASFVFDKPAGVQASPIVDFQGRVVISGDFDFNHQADTKGFIDPSDPIYGSAVCVQGDDSYVSGITIRNSWDNGLSVYKVGLQGQPKGWRIVGVLTRRCGWGVHGPSSPTPGRAGGGVDIAGGAAGTLSDCVDIGSNTGFVFDIGGGAQVVGSNLQSWFATRDPDYTTEHGGTGFYVGSSDTQLVNCTAVFSDWYGFWLDGPGTHSNHTNLLAYLCPEIAFLVKQFQCSLTSLRVKNCGYRTTNTYPAILVDSSGGDLARISIINPAIEGTDQKYAIQFTGAGAISGELIGGHYTGVTATFDGIDNYNIQTMIPTQGQIRIPNLPNAAQVAARPSGTWYNDAGTLKVKP